MRDMHRGRRPVTTRTAPGTGDLDLIAPLSAIDDDRVGLAVAAAAGRPARSRFTLVTPVPVRSLTVIVSAPPGR